MSFLVDTHAHLMMCKRPVKELVQNALDHHVNHIVNVAVNIETAKQSLSQSKEYDMIVPTIGLYPSEVGRDSDVTSMVDLLKSENFKAIGEIGLDYVRCEVPKPIQHAFFERQLEIAIETGLPAIIHNRGADEDVLMILKRFPKVTCVVHCFSSNYAFADTLLSTVKAYFSFTGMITYSGKEDVHEAISKIPLDRIMVETDSPYLLPKSISVQENQPAFVGSIADTIADIRSMDRESLRTQTSQNAIQFFNI